jgi:hypothetical protein
MGTGNRLAPLQDSDGRLYYNYKKGARYKIQDKISGELLWLDIADMSYINDVEYYTIYLGGKLQTVSANRLHYLLHFQLKSIEMEGRRVELPLLESEVKMYYHHRRAWLKEQKRAAEEKLKNTDYAATEKELSRLWCDFSITIEEREQRANEIFEKQQNILDKLGINRAVLSVKPSCESCNDTGFDGGQICCCARFNKSKIKEYCARVRIKSNS